MPAPMSAHVADDVPPPPELWFAASRAAVGVVVDVPLPGTGIAASFPSNAAIVFAESGARIHRSLVTDAPNQSDCGGIPTQAVWPSEA